MREGVRVIASNACFGPTPLRCGFGRAPRDQALRSQGTLGQEGLSSAIALGGNRMSTFLCSLRPDTAPLRFWVGSAGSGAPLAGKLWEG